MDTKFRADYRNPKDGVYEIKQPRQIKHHEGGEVPTPDAGSHPRAVVIVTLDANVAFRTVYGVRRLVDALSVGVGWGTVENTTQRDEGLSGKE
jgi:hypothetical protein